MYIPRANHVDDPKRIEDLIRRYSFATLVTQEDGVPFATHLPILFDRGTGKAGVVLRSHMARANPQWRHLELGTEVLVIFQGPHAYISPSWYEPQVTVPTWNYAAVHVYGVPRLILDHERIVALLTETVTMYESGMSQPWTPNFPHEYRDSQIKAIVAFEIEISRVEAKFKLGQNRSEADYRGVYEALASSDDQASRALAELMMDVRPLPGLGGQCQEDM